MSDGAHQGVGADRALRTILGGEPAPTEPEKRTAEQMRAYLEQPDQQPVGYDEAARRFGRAVLAYLDAHPDDRDVPTNDEYDDDAWRARNWKGKPPVTRKGLYTLVTEAGLFTDDDLTGFMVGWGVNAAKYAIGAPPGRNPALLTIDS